MQEPTVLSVSGGWGGGGGGGSVWGGVFGYFFSCLSFLYFVLSLSVGDGPI